MWTPLGRLFRRCAPARRPIRTTAPRTRFDLLRMRLEERTAPAVLDLTTAGASGTLGGAVFQQIDSASTGTGSIDSFLRIGANTAVTQGFNSSARPVQFNEDNGANFNHDLRLARVPTVLIGGIAYRQFMLDINQSNSSPLLSLDELRIY